MFATARGKLMALAAELGVRVPETTSVTTPAALSAWIAQHGFPAVIKVDNTWGGQGVSIVWSHEHAQRVFARMTARPAFWNAMARMLLERDTSYFLKAIKDEHHSITIQSYISGPPANRAVACWQGEVLAGISVEALRVQHPTGPATVVRIIENPEMSEAVISLVRRLKISGLWGVDFILEKSTGAAYLIEMNPRATPICHLPLGAGQDLPAALYTQLTGIPPATPVARINHDVIALFPGELHRDSTSPYLRSGYHDVPWDESRLIQDCIDRPWSERGLIARLWAALRKRPSLPPFQWKDPLRALHSIDDVCNRVAQDTLTNPTSFTLADKKTTFMR